MNKYIKKLNFAWPSILKTKKLFFYLPFNVQSSWIIIEIYYFAGFTKLMVQIIAINNDQKKNYCNKCLVVPTKIAVKPKGGKNLNSCLLVQKMKN